MGKVRRLSLFRPFSFDHREMTKRLNLIYRHFVLLPGINDNPRFSLFRGEGMK